MKNTRQITLYRGRETRILWVQSRADCVRAIKEVDQYSNAKGAREKITARVKHLLEMAGEDATVEDWLDANDPARKPKPVEYEEQYYNRY